MLNYQNIISEYEATLEGELSCKEGSAILSMARTDGHKFILRIYGQEIPAYRAISGHRCENLPQIYACKSMGGLFVVEEECIDGISLCEMLEGGAHMDPRRAAEILAAVSRAADFLHKTGYIHRDIKPEHILLTPEGRIALIDLDASMRIVSSKHKDTQLLGTTGYAAPEQFGLSRSDQRTDIYAMGILLNELLTGDHPAVKRYRTGSLAAIIDKCIQINPEDRYPTAEALSYDLLRVAHEDSVPAAPTAPVSPAATLAALSKDSSDRPAKKRLLPKQAIIACIAVIAVAGWILLSPALTPEESEGPTDLAVSANRSDNQPALVEGTDYLQLYMDPALTYTTYYNSRMGRQCASLYTESGEEIDQSYTVYADESIGSLEWAPEYNAWGLVSEGCSTGATGFFYAEKDGKTYAISCIVTGEPMSLYTSVPDMDDLGAGYVTAEYDQPAMGDVVVECHYTPGEPTILYLVTSPYFEDCNPSCDSKYVTIESFDDYDGFTTYPYAIYVLTFDHPDGGDGKFTVTSTINDLTVYMYED